MAAVLIVVGLGGVALGEESVSKPARNHRQDADATLATASNAVNWAHPGGIVTPRTVAEVREKIAKYPALRDVYEGRKKSVQPWLAVSSERLRQVFPRKRGNVYHTFSCPQDRVRLTFDPFNPDRFTCPICGKEFDPATDAGVYPPGNRYQGTMYDGWVCLFFLEAGEIAGDLGIIGQVENDPRYIERGIEVLMLHAESLPGIETRRDKYGPWNVLLTYHREGDGKVLCQLATAYEVLRDRMTADQRARFEQAVLRRMLDDVMLEPIYRENLNNLYQWHKCIVQCGVALERDDLIDWSVGFGARDPRHQPEHLSIRRLAEIHYKPDGAFWEMCSGYHLYPLSPFCELAVMGHNLSVMDPKRFPADRYDMTRPENPVGRVVRDALTWFMSMAMPDRTMPTIGDSMAPRAGMADYYPTAEIGYRWFNLREVGDYESLRKGPRNWWSLVYGADEIVPRPTPFTSSFLSSGWVSLRSEWEGNRVWAGLNALIPGGAHQHADRLSLVLYSHGKLLALEKATPYNELTTRDLGTMSYSHNTVTIDKTSQKQGEALKGEEVPTVAYFHDGPMVRFAEVRADRIYPGAKVYRRSVAVIEDVVVDCFRVVGGKTHDWMVHHAGPAPRLSIETKERAFEPVSWVVGGNPTARSGRMDETWAAEWTVDYVHSRLTMLGSPGTEVHALETYPVDNAVIIAGHPACQSLCVRRGNDAPFVAVWDAWQDRPNVRGIAKAAGADGLIVETRKHRYRMTFGPGQAHYDDGATIRSDAAFAILRDEDTLTMIGGTSVEVSLPGGHVAVRADRPATVAASYLADGVTVRKINDIEHETHGGRDHPRPEPSVQATVTGGLWGTARKEHR